MTSVPEVKKGFFYYTKKFALWYGAGAAAAAKLLKSNMYTFPPGWSTYMGYFCAVVVFVCCFLAGPAIAEYIRKIGGLMRALQNLDTKKPDEDEI